MFKFDQLIYSPMASRCLEKKIDKPIWLMLAETLAFAEGSLYVDYRPNCGHVYAKEREQIIRYCNIKGNDVRWLRNCSFYLRKKDVLKIYETIKEINLCEAGTRYL